MIDNQENTSQEPQKISQLSDVIIPPTPEPAASAFVSRLQELKAASRASLQRVTSFLSVGTIIPPSEEAKDSQVNVPALFQEVTEEKGLSPTEHLQKVNQALGYSAQLREQVNAGRYRLYESLGNKLTERRKVDGEISELDEYKGLSKIFTIFRKGKGRLTKERSVLQGEVDIISKEITDRDAELVRIDEQEKPVHVKQEDLIFLEISEEIKSIKNKYEQLLQEIIKDGTIPSEIIELYIRREIDPKVEENIKWRKLPDSTRDEFYQALRSFLKNRDSPEGERQQYKDTLESYLIGDNAVFSDAWSACRNLYEYGQDRIIIQKLVAELAVEDITLIKEATLSHYEGYGREKEEARGRFFTTYANALGVVPTDENSLYRWSAPFGNSLYIAQTDASVKQIPDMNFWRAVKDSPATNQVFGEVIEKQDQKYYQLLLEKSLLEKENSNYLGILAANYHTPEVIRNLILLSSVKKYHLDQGNTYASGALRLLSERPDWEEILDEAEKVYPLIKNARYTLMSSNFEEREEFQIQKSAEDFILDLYENETVDKNIRELALKGLTNKSIISVLSKRNVFSESETAVLEGVVNFTSENYLYEYLATHSEMVSKVLSNELTIELAASQHWLSKIQTDFLRGAITFINNNPEMFSLLVTNRVNFEFFGDELRRNLSQLLQPESKDKHQLSLEIIKRFNKLSEEILKNQNNIAILSYLTNESLIRRLEEPSFKTDLLPIFLEAYKNCPALLTNHNFQNRFCYQFEGEQSVTFFNKMSIAYKDSDQQLDSVLGLIAGKSLTKERALELPTKAGDILSNELFEFSHKFATIYLNTDQDCAFFRSVVALYPKDLKEIADCIDQKHLTREIVQTFSKEATAFSDEKMRETRLFIFNNADSLIKDISDIKFMNILVGEFGKKADRLIRDYQECLAAGAISTADKELVLEFVRQLRVISPSTISGYKAAKEEGSEQVYLAQLKALAEKLTGSSPVTEEERSKPYYKDMLKHVYSNNSGSWGSLKRSESCSDRSSDLAEFKIRPRYEIDLLSQSEIRVKAGETLDPSVNQSVQRPILDVAERINTLGHDKEKMQAFLQESIDKTLQEIIQKGGLNGIDLEAVAKLDEKLFLILTDSIFGSKAIDPEAVKDLVINYEVATFEDISDYIAGTRDRVARANNQDYALLCEVGTFYSDRIKEVNRRLIQTALGNPAIAAIMPNYFKKLAQETTTVQRKGVINKLQVEKLGASKGFIKQLGKILEQSRGRKYSQEEVERIVARYESVTGGLTEKASNSPNPETRAFYGLLRSQREKTFEAIRVITGQEVDPRQVNLGEIDLQQILTAEASIREGKYDEEQFASYTAQRFIDLFEDERTRINGELAKYESSSGKQREVLYGYITKSKESANARMVGGVCVSADNPGTNSGGNIWDMPNYLQMVFQEPDTLQCQGLVLLHHFNEGGKRVLTASFNPSSTYLYSVDEEALFKGITGSLEEFAEINGFDMIAVSHNHAIRTNRTGGEFERAMSKRVSQIGKTFSFKTPKQFSYRPSYQIQEMDVIWEKPVNKTVS